MAVEGMLLLVLLLEVMLEVDIVGLSNEIGCRSEEEERKKQCLVPF
jgi:hypothetical protein